MIALMYKLYEVLRGNHFALTATVVGSKQLQIGSACVIEPYCYLKGEKPNGRLILGNHVIMKRFSHLSAKGGGLVKIMDNCYIGYNNWIGGHGDIIIGPNFMSGMNVVVISSNHDYMEIPIPYHGGKEIAEKIEIQGNVWVGANSVILPGVTVGHGSVIAAGSVVTSNIPPNVIASGNPASVLMAITR